MSTDKPVDKTTGNAKQTGDEEFPGQKSAVPNQGGTETRDEGTRGFGEGGGGFGSYKTKRKPEEPVRQPPTDGDSRRATK